MCKSDSFHTRSAKRMMIYPQINFCQSVQKQHQERQKEKDKKGKNASKVTAFLQAFSS